MTDCPRGDEMRDVLPDLLNERLDAVERAEVERHVASCPACAAELAMLRSMRSALAAAPRVDAARIAAAVHASRSAAASAPNVRPLAARRPASDVRRIAWRIAAAFVVAALGVGTWAVTHRQPASVTIASNQAPPRATEPVVSPPIVGATPPSTPHQPAPATKTPPNAPQMLASTGHRGLVMDGGVNDLSDGDVKMLLQSLDSLTAIPDADPTPMSYQIDDDGGVR